MILLPAVDIRGGRAVRLHLGDFDAETVYADSPLGAARGWVEAGARALHVVDLDGARSGEPGHLDELRVMADELNVPIQWGGGLRSLDDVRGALEAGADRVVLGTAALRTPELLDAALELGGAERVLAAVDVRGGTVAVSGWSESSEVSAQELVEHLEARGVERFVHTSVDRDGTLEGPDVEAVRRLATAMRGRLIVSGGIASVADLERLGDLGLPNLDGVIAGKALYEQRFTVAEANAALERSRRGAPSR
ncbi:MAG TPA: 1-(5-phosphoribosyl)-5-[(5-phosphoribosylamino)methylideneamino]imidazole-4-carboxamide isomerase [Thermoleophilaceae bacterium]|nr:1-(5-phosphoribosyl)-5-[(5-phosphoribosylamino)methylideneamino]imidazole-4-carboxamide isomerase [Thermoleophilaceae bacterium]